MKIEAGRTRSEDATIAEATELLDAGQDARAFDVIERLAEETDDPDLRRELEALVANGRASSRGFRKTWDRVMMAYQVGR